MRKRIDAYILLDFLEGWRTRLKNEQIIALNGIWAAKVEQSIKQIPKPTTTTRRDRQKSTSRPLKPSATICWTTSKSTMPPASNTSG